MPVVVGQVGLLEEVRDVVAHDIGEVLGVDDPFGADLGDSEVQHGLGRQVERARIVLAAADGAGTSGTARRLGVSRPTVIKWRDRFAQYGIAGLDDQPRSGRPKIIDDAAIIAATLEPPPESLAVTHWSSRLLGRHLGIGDATVARAWRRYGVKPWRRETSKFSTDPEVEAKARDVVGLYLNPREPRGADVSSGGDRPSPLGLSQQAR